MYRLEIMYQLVGVGCTAILFCLELYERPLNPHLVSILVPYRYL